MRKLDEILAAKWLGNGRSTECLLACVAFTYGLLLLIPGAAAEGRATYDLAWHGYGQLFAVPLLAKAILTGAGFMISDRACAASRITRTAGAFIGTATWLWLAAKFALVDAWATPAFAFTIWSAIFSVRIMAMALAGLPRPSIADLS